MDLFSRLSLNDEESAARNNTYNDMQYRRVDDTPYHHTDDTLYQENDIPSLQGLSLGEEHSNTPVPQYNLAPTRCIPYPTQNNTYAQQSSTSIMQDNLYAISDMPSTQNNTLNTGRCAPLPEENDTATDAASDRDVDMTGESLLPEGVYTESASPQSSGENTQQENTETQLHETTPTHTPAEHPAAPRLQVNNFYYGVPPEMQGEHYAEAPAPQPPRNRRTTVLSLSTLAVAYLLHTARKDLQALWHADLAALEHESLQCATHYAANRCGQEGLTLPALAERCAAWAQCMARDNRRAYAARLVSAAALAGRLLDAFVRPLGGRAVCLCVAVCALWAWAWTGRARDSSPRRSPERSAESPLPPRPEQPHSRALTLASDS
ncbi:Brl1 protein [Maudiozyma humilis]|uniref:Brl1 protein n=1 Tax=Maudiozyma humilis TaxID=51915 RepID=A0AAV5RRI7_MAUHU|nr:Brl1 protein [Kazachstania humilis]